MRKLFFVVTIIAFLLCSNLVFADTYKFSVGYGQQYGGFGLSAEAQLNFIALGGGLGYFTSPITSQGIIGYEVFGKLIYPVSALSSAYLAAGLGTIGCEETLVGTQSNVSSIIGPFVLIGSEFNFSKNTFLLVDVGMAFSEKFMEYFGQKSLITFDIGVGFKSQ